MSESEYTTAVNRNTVQGIFQSFSNARGDRQKRYIKNIDTLRYCLMTLDNSELEIGKLKVSFFHTEIGHNHFAYFSKLSIMKLDFN